MPIFTCAYYIPGNLFNRCPVVENLIKLENKLLSNLWGVCLEKIHCHLGKYCISFAVPNRNKKRNRNRNRKRNRCSFVPTQIEMTIGQTTHRDTHPTNPQSTIRLEKLVPQAAPCHRTTAHWAGTGQVSWSRTIEIIAQNVVRGKDGAVGGCQ